MMINLDVKKNLRKNAFILNSKQIIQLKKQIKFGHTLALVAQNFGMSRATLVNIINRDPEAAKAYSEARMEFFKPKLSWFESLFEPENINKVDPNLLMRAFEFTMRARAAWGVEPNLDSLGEEGEVIERPEVDIIKEKVIARFIEDNQAEVDKLIAEAKERDAL